jgi:hypothetical protein
VERLRGAVTAEVVQLAGAEGFRYQHVALPGYAGLVTLYAVPLSGEGSTVLACHAPSGQQALMGLCEQTVVGLHPVGQATGVNLAPKLAYGESLAKLIAGLDRERGSLRAAMHQGAAPATLEADAHRLATAFARAGGAIAALEAPAPVDQAQATLASDLGKVAAAYTSLAEAAAEAERYNAQRGQVEAGEATAAGALADFSLLGYRLR